MSANLLCNQLLDAFKNMQTQCQSKLCERKKHHCHHHYHHHHYHQSTIIAFAIVVKNIHNQVSAQLIFSSPTFSGPSSDKLVCSRQQGGK